MRNRNELRYAHNAGYIPIRPICGDKMGKPILRKSVQRGGRGGWVVVGGGQADTINSRMCNLLYMESKFRRNHP